MSPDNLGLYLRYDGHTKDEKRAIKKFFPLDKSFAKSTRDEKLILQCLAEK